MPCPHCSGELSPYDRRIRTYIDADGEKVTLNLRRVRCRNCRRIHIELPDYIAPFKRYCIEVIEKVCEKSHSRIPEDCSTRQKIRKWYRKVLPHLKAVWQRLIKQNLMSPFENPNFKNLVKASVNSGFWIYHPFGNCGREKYELSSS